MRFKEYMNEVFTLSMDGIKSDVSEYASNYEFKDPSTENATYKVVIYRYTNDNSFGSYSLNRLNNLEKEILDKGIHFKGYDGIGEVSLLINSKGKSLYNRSGLGNSYYVYSKMLSCIHDFVSKFQPLFLEFTGADNGMNLLYDKMIRMSNKEFPEYGFTYYKEDYYIRSDIYNLIKKSDSDVVPNSGLLRRQHNYIDVDTDSLDYVRPEKSKPTALDKEMASRAEKLAQARIANNKSRLLNIRN